MLRRRNHSGSHYYLINLSHRCVVLPFPLIALRCSICFANAKLALSFLQLTINEGLFWYSSKGHAEWPSKMYVAYVFLRPPPIQYSIQVITTVHVKPRTCLLNWMAKNIWYENTHVPQMWLWHWATLTHRFPYGMAFDIVNCNLFLTPSVHWVVAVSHPGDSQLLHIS